MMQDKLMLSLVSLGLFLGLLFGAYQYGKLAERKHQVDEQAIAQAEGLEQRTQLIKQLEIQHDKTNDALNVLLDTEPVRVQVPVYRACAAAIASGGELPTPQPERASDPGQEAFDQFAAGLESDAIEWSKALNACSVMQVMATSDK